MPSRIYHWKHGWIPLDHTAALSKSKGSEAGARRALATSHAAGHAHDSVVAGTYGGGTHVRGLQPVAAEHLRRDSRITAAFSPDSRRFALHDPEGRHGLATGTVTTSIPEHLAEHFNARGHKVDRLVVTARGDHKVQVKTKEGSLKLFDANGSDIHQVDPQMAEPPRHAPAPAPSTYVATHTVMVREHGVGGRSYGVIKPNGGGLGSTDIINAGLVNHVNENHYTVIGYERRVLTTVGADGVIRRFKADGSNMHKPVIAKSNTGTLHDIGDWKAVHPHEAIPTDGPKAINAHKVQQAFTRGNKTVLIEPKMTQGETEAFLNHVGQAFDITGSNTDHAITVHVPSGDRTFSSGRTHGYVYRGDSTRVHIAPSVAKASANHRAEPGTGAWLMSAGHGVHPTLYTLTHELGHTVDNRSNHTFGPPGPHGSFPMLGTTEASALHREHKGNLSTYGRSAAVEGYAEAFAHHHLTPHSKATTDAAHDMTAAAYARRYGWGSVTSWRTGSDALVAQAARSGDVGAVNEARRRGLSF